MKQIIKNMSDLFDGYSGLENKFKWVGVNIFKMKYTVGIFYCLNEKLYTFKIIFYICQLMRTKTESYHWLTNWIIYMFKYFLPGIVDPLTIY